MLVRMQRQRISFASLVGMQAGAATPENSIEVPQKLKIEVPYDPAIALLGIYPRDTGVLFRRGTCTPMFIEIGRASCRERVARLLKNSLGVQISRTQNPEDMHLEAGSVIKKLQNGNTNWCSRSRKHYGGSSKN